MHALIFFSKKNAIKQSDVFSLQVGLTEIRPQQCTADVSKHSGPLVLLCHSSMGQPGKLLSSQVVAIQWNLLQKLLLAFVKNYKQDHWLQEL